MTRPDTMKASLTELAQHLRDELDGVNGKEKKYLLLYGYNGTGKTRLSVEFKNLGKLGGQQDTLYFNAFTEDLFTWDNDLEEDQERVLKFNSDSRFFAGLQDFELENRIYRHLTRYADFEFRIDYEQAEITFSREVKTLDAAGEEVSTKLEGIKVSRGEENIFIWCFFLTIVELALAGETAYEWVKYIYIDDPISSLDEHNAIAVANHLASLVGENIDHPRFVISTHHPLFFNVLHNEFTKKKGYKYFLAREKATGGYILRETGDTPFFQHVSMLVELHNVAESGKIYTYHFNMLRNVLEKTASFHGFKQFGDCIRCEDNEAGHALHSRLINILSHGNYSLYDPVEMIDENKEHFRRILADLISLHRFNPALFPVPQPSPLPAINTEGQST